MPLSQPINVAPLPSCHLPSNSTLVPFCKKHKMRRRQVGPYLGLTLITGVSSHSGMHRIKNSWGLLHSKSSEERKAQKIKGASRKLRTVEIR